MGAELRAGYVRRTGRVAQAGAQWHAARLFLAASGRTVCGPVQTADSVNRPDHNELHVAWIDSPVGLLRAAATQATLRSLQFTDGGTDIQSQPGAGTPILDQTRRELQEYFAGKRRNFEVPLSFAGTPFQERVWSV